MFSLDKIFKGNPALDHKEFIFKSTKTKSCVFYRIFGLLFKTVLISLSDDSVFFRCPCQEHEPVMSANPTPYSSFSVQLP